MREDREQRLLKLVKKANWASDTPRLAAFASFRLARLGRVTGPRGKTADDYVTRAVVEVLGGQHDPGEARSLFALICVVIALNIRIDVEKEALTPV
jgi:hypothetical protein